MALYNQMYKNHMYRSNIAANAKDDLNFASSNYDGGDINVQRLGFILRNVKEAVWLMWTQ